MTKRLAQAWLLIKKSGPGFGVEALVNFVLPFLVYTWTKSDLGDVGALIASSLPPIAWSILEFARKRRIDALSLLVLLGIALSLAAFFGGGSVRFLQLRETLVKGIIGLVFLGSAAIGRPLVYELARASMLRKSKTEAAQLEAIRNRDFFRRAMTLMTLVWGLGMIAETAIAGFLIFRLPISNYLIVGPIFGYGCTGMLVLWTVWYGRHIGRVATEKAHADAKALANANGRAGSEI